MADTIAQRDVPENRANFLVAKNGPEMAHVRQSPDLEKRLAKLDHVLALGRRQLALTRVQLPMVVRSLSHSYICCSLAFNNREGQSSAYLLSRRLMHVENNDFTLIIVPLTGD